MCFLRKKKVSVKTGKDRELISENAKAVDALIILAGNNEVLVKHLQEIKEKIKYLLPSNEDKIYDFDKKIKNLIEDTRIALVKADGEASKKVDNALLQIKLVISDRNVKL